jgi:hypothetical protein
MGQYPRHLRHTAGFLQVLAARLSETGSPVGGALGERDVAGSPVGLPFFVYDQMVFGFWSATAPPVFSLAGVGRAASGCCTPVGDAADLIGGPTLRALTGRST